MWQIAAGCGIKNLELSVENSAVMQYTLCSIHYADYYEYLADRLQYAQYPIIFLETIYVL
ncbi:MAG: hypothetical protein D3920_13515 [Candidatus Electrothrix sp. AW2]|nr:hypothetical protein [Candidatus Electrothrix gigas]